MRIPNFVAVVSVALLQVANAYSNNCKGSGQGLGGNVGDCYNGLNNIDRAASYGDQAQFSAGHCYLIYATNGAGAQPISGQTYVDTANAILRDCASQAPAGSDNWYEGSYGTGNCESCHVTVNYRS